MTERLDYGRRYDDYDDDDAGHDGDHKEGREQEYGPSSYDADHDFIHEDYDTEAESFPDQHDQVEHQVDFAEDDSGETGFDAQIGRWRSKAYRRRRGKFVPPNMRRHRTPVFVRIKDLQGRDGG